MLTTVLQGFLVKCANGLYRLPMSYDPIIKKLLTKLQEALGQDLIGVLVGGSRIRGDGDKNSDLDVVVVVKRPERKRWNFIVDGLEIETLINPLGQMKRYFVDERSDGRGLMPHLCATGVIVFDPLGTMSSLQSEAQSIWRDGPPPLSARERWQFRYYVADSMRDLDDVVTEGDEYRAAHLIGILRPKLIDMHYRIAGRWLHQHKRVLRDLETWDQATALLVKQSFGRHDIHEATDKLRELALHVLSPLGGPMPLEWETDWGPTEGAA
jgi:predicted nucleotidyltransferase